MKRSSDARGLLDGVGDATLVPTTVGAHDVWLLHGATAWAGALGRRMQTHVDGSAGASAGLGALFLWYGHFVTLPCGCACRTGRRHERRITPRRACLAGHPRPPNAHPAFRSRTNRWWLRDQHRTGGTGPGNRDGTVGRPAPPATPLREPAT